MNRFLSTDPLPQSERDARNLTDALALVWIFFSVLSVGLFFIAVNALTLAVALVTALLGPLWYFLCHLRS